VVIYGASPPSNILAGQHKMMMIGGLIRQRRVLFLQGRHTIVFYDEPVVSGYYDKRYGKSMNNYRYELELFSEILKKQQKNLPRFAALYCNDPSW
jgi:hypothetical protein